MCFRESDGHAVSPNRRCKRGALTTAAKHHDGEGGEQNKGARVPTGGPFQVEREAFEGLPAFFWLRSGAAGGRTVLARSPNLSTPGAVALSRATLTPSARAARLPSD